MRLIALLIAVFLFFASAADAALSKSSPSGEEVWRINCGATKWDYTDPDGNWWVRDEPYANFYRWGFMNGAVSSTSSYIKGTDLDPVFQTNRWGGTNMSYKIDMPNGRYQVKLMFAETYWHAIGKRVFNVAIEGVTVLNNHDIYAEKGYKTADEHVFNTTVGDEALEITFPVISKDKAVISGIEIRAVEVTDEAFLNFIEKKMFWYFWNEANATTGLIKDSEQGFASSSADVSSIAVTGLGLSIITIGAERGWITPQQARDRIMNTLNTFEAVLYNLHGFWYHFVDINNGMRRYNSEVSTIDSAIFIIGALQAGEYFRSTYPEIAAKAEQLYRRMEWAWWLNRNDGNPWDNQFINMGWQPEYQPWLIPNGGPEGGCFTKAWWNQYCETLLIDVLAIGSPTYPVSNDAWKNMARQKVNAFGMNFIQVPPLFTHQYHHLWLDFRGKRDGAADLWNGTYDTSMDYWENTRRATLANRQTCLNDPQGRYETNRWGLTACDSPDGRYQVYGGEPGGYHDGTVAPTAAGSSLEFTPAESLSALRYMFFQYKHHIWGRHGFCDAFNVSGDWRSDVSLGLDNGPMVIAIENYRTGLVRDTAMKNPYIWKGLAKAFSPTIEIIQHDTQLRKDNWQPVKAQILNLHTSIQDFEDYNGTAGLYFWDAWDSQPALAYLPSPAHNGSRSVSTQGHTVGIYPQGGTMDLSGATHVGVWVYDTAGSDTVELRLRDFSGASQPVWSAMPAVWNQWTLILWPLSSFTSVDKRNIQSLEIYLRWKGQYYFDDLFFTRESDIIAELKDGMNNIRSSNTVDGVVYQDGVYDVWVYTPPDLMLGENYFYLTFFYPVSSPNIWEARYSWDTTSDEPWIPLTP